jgi:hypothetical protein
MRFLSGECSRDENNHDSSSLLVAHRDSSVGKLCGSEGNQNEFSK